MVQLKCQVTLFAIDGFDWSLLSPDLDFCRSRHFNRGLLVLPSGVLESGPVVSPSVTLVSLKTSGLVAWSIAWLSNKYN